MEHFFLVRLVLLFTHYGYFVLFPVAVFEGPVVAMIAGAFAASGELHFAIAFLVLVAADLTGDVMYYTLGRFAHTRFIQSIGKKIGITDERISPLREGFVRHDAKLLLLGKTQALGSVILYFAGATRMSFYRFLGWNLLGTLPKVLLFELVGYFLGQSVIYSTRYVTDVGIVTFVMALLLLGGYWVAKRYMEQEFERV